MVLMGMDLDMNLALFICEIGGFVGGKSILAVAKYTLYRSGIFMLN